MRTGNRRRYAVTTSAAMLIAFSGAAIGQAERPDQQREQQERQQQREQEQQQRDLQRQLEEQERQQRRMQDEQREQVKRHQDGQVVAHENLRFALSEKVIGTDVHDTSGQKIGTTEDLVVNARNGNITHAVLSVGGWLGIGDKMAVVPMRDIRWNEQRSGFVYTGTREMVEQCYHCDSEAWPKIENRNWTAGLVRSASFRGEDLRERRALGEDFGQEDWPDWPDRRDAERTRGGGGELDRDRDRDRDPTQRDRDRRRPTSPAEDLEPDLDPDMLPDYREGDRRPGEQTDRDTQRQTERDMQRQTERDTQRQAERDMQRQTERAGEQTPPLRPDELRSLPGEREPVLIRISDISGTDVAAPEHDAGDREARETDRRRDDLARQPGQQRDDLARQPGQQRDDMAHRPGQRSRDVLLERGQFEKVGKIDGAVVELTTAQVPFVIVSSGGVMGFGGDDRLVPWEAMTMTGNRLVLRNIGAEEFKNLEQLSEDDVRNLNQKERLARIYGPFNVEPRTYHAFPTVAGMEDDDVDLGG